MPTERLFFLDDVCTVKDDSEVVAFIERSYTDVDTHEPYPSQHISGMIERHHRVSKPAFKRFAVDGIPPKGTVLVSWADESKMPMIIPEKELDLIDRPLLNGDIVKKSVDDHMSGTVLRSIKTCDLRSTGKVRERATGRTLHANWYTLNRDEQSPFDVDEGDTLRGIPASELQYVQQYNEGDMIVYKNWIGRIRELSDEVTIRLLDGSVVAVKDELDLDPYDPLVSERFSIGDLVTTRKANLRTGRWVYGSYSPNTRPVGSVVDVRTVEVDVDWLECKLGFSGDEPMQILSLDELDSGDVKLYDRTRRPSISVPDTTLTRSTTDTELVHGVRVKFKDLMGACVKYDGTSEHGKIDRIDRKDTLGYDMNAFVVTKFSRDLVVQWQDLSITVEHSFDLIPDESDDVNVVYPGEIVCTQSHTCSAETEYAIQPDKVGIVQAVNPNDRVADVRWCPEARMRFIGEDDRLPTSNLGHPSAEVESVSLYDIRAPPILNARRGDLVFVTNPTSTADDTSTSSDPATSSVIPIDASHGIEAADWIGEVVDISLDGLFTVCLGAATKVRNVIVNADQVFIAIRAEDDELDQETDDDGMSYIEDSDDNELTAAEEADMMDLMHDDDIELDDASIEEEDDGWKTESDEVSGDEEDMVHTGEVGEFQSMGPEGRKQDELDATQPAIGLPGTSDSAGHPVASLNKEEIFAASSNLLDEPPPYLLLETEAPSDHRYRTTTSALSSKQLRAILKEHEIFRKAGAVPGGVFVRSWESRTDIFRVLIVGPTDTPYAMAPFILDVKLPPSYPAEPPAVHFHHWSLVDMPLQGRVNPNLYEDGNVCLSLLGTWTGEGWIPGKSTVLQVVVSLLGLVLVQEPYYSKSST